MGALLLGLWTAGNCLLLPYDLEGDRSVLWTALLASTSLGVGTISTSSLQLREGEQSAQYTIALRTEPSAAVRVRVTPGSEVLVDGNSVAFTVTLDQANWQSGVALTVTIQDDLQVNADRTSTIDHVIEEDTPDPDFAGKPLDSIAVHIIENDTVGINRAPATLVLSEGGAAGSYQISMTSQPQANVAIAIASDAQIDVLTPSLTFTTANWATPQTVNIGAVNDGTIESATISAISHTVTSTDPFYNGFALGSVSATVNDNDLADIRVNVSGLADAIIAPIGNLTLQNNGGDDLVIATDGVHTFSTGIANGGAYSVTVSGQPSNRGCHIVNGSGTVAGAHVTNINVLCDFAQSYARFANISINGGSYDVTVTPGAALTLNVNRALGWGPAGACPGCISPTVIGFPGTPPSSAFCVSGSRTYVPPAAPVYNSIVFNLTAPAAPGTYYLNAWTSWDFCSNMLPAFTTHGTPIARVVVTP